MDLLQVALPTAGALIGAYLGVQWRAKVVERTELRALLDEASSVLTRAGQQRGLAYVRFVAEGVGPSETVSEALSAFRVELSQAEQIRDRLRFRSARDSDFYEAFSAALEALGRVSIALGTALMLPADRHDRASGLHDDMIRGEEEFELERRRFLEEAQVHTQGSWWPRWLSWASP